MSVRSSVTSAVAPPPFSFVDHLLYLCQRADDPGDDALRLARADSGPLGFADDVGARAISALERSEDEAVPYLKFKNRALREHVARPPEFFFFFWGFSERPPP